MSQMSSTAGNGSQNIVKTTAGGAVFLLTAAVILGVGLLHALDTTSNAKAQTATETKATEQQQQVNQTSNTTNAPPVTPTRAPGDVKILVANGVAIQGVASKVSGKVKQMGYQMLTPGNTVKTETASAVQYASGYQTEAQAVATSLSIPASNVIPFATPAAVQELGDANVLVIVGSELAASVTTTTPGSSNTTVVNPAVNGPLTSGAGSNTNGTNSSSN